MTLDTEITLKRIATYERVSSDDQRQRRTILTQTDELAKQLQNDPGVRLVERYIDDGISGTIPMVKRPAGRRLMEDAAKGLFKEVWVYKVDRLGRDAIDPLIVWRDLELLGVKVNSVTEGISDPFMYQIHVAMAAKERRTFLERSAAGIERTVKNGHFPGGIKPLGYEVLGLKNEAHLIPSTKIIWANWTAVDLVVQIYQWLGIEHWSCPHIANHLNDLGVPTAYQQLIPGPRRAERGTGFQAKWRAGRIRNLVILTVYKGIYQYGKRSKKKRNVWEVEAPALVTPELWQAAQAALTRNRLIGKNTPRHYLLTGLIKCGICGKTYCAAHGRDKIVWWRCNGRMTSRYDSDNRCQSKMVKSTEIENIVWTDIEHWLRDPGDLLQELYIENDHEKTAAIWEAEVTILKKRWNDLELEKKGYHRQNAQGLLNDIDLRGFVEELAEKKISIEKRIAELSPAESEPEILPVDLLHELRRRLDNGLSEEQRQEIARLLVKRIVIHTKTEDGNRYCKAEIQYRFIGAVNFCTDKDSSPRRA